MKKSTSPPSIRLASLLLVSLAFLHASASAVEVVFGSATIEARIRNLIDKPEGPIEDTDLIGVGLTTLEVVGFNVADLSGLEFAVDLETIDLSSNLISDLMPLANLPSLSILRLANNLISDLAPLETITTLSELVLDNNEIVMIDALVRNLGLSAGDAVFISGNPLDLESVCDDIPRLEERSVLVVTDVVCPGSVEGRVIDAASGNPIDCATIVAGPFSSPAITTTDLNGNYLFESVTSGTNILEVFAPGYENLSSAVVIPEEMTVEVLFSLVRREMGVVVRAQVVDALFLQPLGGVLVEARIGTTQLGNTYTCATGEFEIPVTSGMEGIVDATFSAPGFQVKEMSFDTTVKGLSTVTLQPLVISSTGSVTGTVTDAVTMEGVPDARVVVKAIGATVEFTSITNPLGEFSVRNLAPGNYIVKVTSPLHPGDDDRTTVAVATTEIVVDFVFGTVPPTPNKNPGCGPGGFTAEGVSPLADALLILIVLCGLILPSGIRSGIASYRFFHNLSG